MASSLNFAPGAAVSNATVVGVGVGGSVCLWSSVATDLVVDVNGVFDDGAGIDTFAPRRLLDTRSTDLPPTDPSDPPTDPTEPPNSGRFETLPPGSDLPSGAECAGRVRSAPETRADNTQNRTRGTAPNGRHPRADGDFTGTTDEILQWVACKWGIDEDLVRAQAAIESWWHQEAAGDLTNDQTECHPALRTSSGPCPESIGLLQVRWLYHQEAFEDLNAIRSTAYNADYTYAVWRGCFEGVNTWFNNVEGRGDYAAGDAQGCLGAWFSGRWYTPKAVGYIGRLLDYRDRRVWETPEFLNG